MQNLLCFLRIKCLYPFSQLELCKVHPSLRQHSSTMVALRPHSKTVPSLNPHQAAHDLSVEFTCSFPFPTTINKTLRQLGQVGPKWWCTQSQRPGLAITSDLVMYYDNKAALPFYLDHTPIACLTFDQLCAKNTGWRCEYAWVQQKLSPRRLLFIALRMCNLKRRKGKICALTRKDLFQTLNRILIF